jgi:para-aminobenzoate synthetase component 1
LKPRVSKSEYILAVVELQKHIHQGDIYEVNYCQEFGAHHKLDNPFQTWCRLNELTTAPFSCFVKLGPRYVLCASPERFLKKENSKIISQPIKGTIRRGKDAREDLLLREQLHKSKKDRSENVMIVDLVRNDLSKHATKDSVEVTELFGVHTFRTVHHMISTIKAEILEGTTFSQLLADSFPMGSMTGAPKIKAMQLIEEFENCRRGWYSGAIGYIDPNGNFDFNVVIRSIFYNDEVPYISYLAGGAITALSDPEDEYAESMLKAEAMMKALM